ncbi:MAG: amino acid permease [Myxococcales bacterium]|nr:amino acid permease [Myxococcales bacterium]
MGQELKRSLSLVDVVALGINGVIGTGIFLLPGKAAGMMGPASILTLLFAALLSFLIALCFAELGSKFRGTGGAYLYALRTFGDTTGFFVGWMVLMVTLTSWAALVNALANLCAGYVPALADGMWRNVAMVGFMSFLTGINLLGAKMGARVSNFFTVAKLLPILLFIGVGLSHIDTGHFTPFAPHGFGSNFFEATLLILYAYVGFEALVVPAGEMKNPRRAVPLALLTVLLISVVVYVGVLVVATGTLAGLAGHGNPVVACSELFMGDLGASIIAGGIIVSMIGVNAAQVLVGPRRVFALSENGHLPRVLSRVDSKGTPHLALIVLLIISASLAVLIPDFKTLAMVSVVARFAQYISTCIAALLLQFREPKISESGDAKIDTNDAFRLPLGPVIPIVALVLCAVLLYNSAMSNIMPFKYGGLALLLGVPVYAAILLLRRERREEG